MTSIPEKVVTTTSTKTYNYFKIEEIRVKLGECAELRVFLYNRTENPAPEEEEYHGYYEKYTDHLLDVIFIRIEGDDYKNWGTDDEYINTYISTYVSNM
jgi:hypothetical protein